MKWLREVFLGNWRNKGVALFFACAIWFVAYQSEKQESREEFSVSFRPVDPERWVITSLKTSRADGGGEEVFDGRIVVYLSGPRKLIEELRFSEERKRPPFKVLPEKEVYYTFSDKDFEFVGKGVTIISVSPSSVRITQDMVGEVPVKDLASRLSLRDRRPGHLVVTSRVEPSEARVVGPQSLLSSISVRLPFSMELRDENEGDVEVVTVFGDESLPQFVRDTITVTPRTVKVSVTTRAQTETLALDAVSVNFRIPLPQAPINIVSDDLDLVRGTLPVELHGPRDQIKRIEELYKENSLVLSVPVPARVFRSGQESLQTFEERDLELYGFPEVQVRKHKSRKEAGLWTYRIVPVRAKEGE